MIWDTKVPGGGMILRILGYKSSALIVHVYKKVFLPYTLSTMPYAKWTPNQTNPPLWLTESSSPVVAGRPKPPVSFSLFLYFSFHRFNFFPSSPFCPSALYLICSSRFFLLSPFIFDRLFGRLSAECVWWCIWMHWSLPYIVTLYNLYILYSFAYR